MIKTPTHGQINMYSQLDNVIQFRLVRINEMISYFIAEIHERQTLS